MATKIACFQEWYAIQKNTIKFVIIDDIQNIQEIVDLTYIVGGWCFGGFSMISLCRSYTYICNCSELFSDAFSKFAELLESQCIRKKNINIFKKKTGFRSFELGATNT